MNAIKETDEKLRGLPKPPSDNPVSEVLQALGGFVRELDRRVEGTPEENGLLQKFRPHQVAFKTAIRQTAPQFVPWGRTSTKELPEAVFLSNEGGDYVAGGSRAMNNKIYIEDVLKRALK